MRAAQGRAAAPPGGGAAGAADGGGVPRHPAAAPAGAGWQIRVEPVAAFSGGAGGGRAAEPVVCAERARGAVVRRAQPGGHRRRPGDVSRVLETWWRRAARAGAGGAGAVRGCWAAADLWPGAAIIFV